MRRVGRSVKLLGGVEKELDDFLAFLVTDFPAIHYAAAAHTLNKKWHTSLSRMT